MTLDELDQARAGRALELYRKAGNKIPIELGIGCIAVSTIAARLAREGWEPEDPLLKEALAVVDQLFGQPMEPSEWDKRHFGVEDRKTAMTTQIDLCALRRGMELGAGK